MAKRDPAGTQQRILAAALAEFSKKGLAGARVDAIAQRAQVNKRMLYHYFGDKQALYREIVRRKAGSKAQSTRKNPADLGEALAEWYDEESADQNWIRLLTWEALGSSSSGSDGARGEPFKAMKSWIQAEQDAGRIAKLDPEHLMLALLAVDMFPVAFPQLTRAVTGRSPTDPAFKRRYKAFLRELAGYLERRS